MRHPVNHHHKQRKLIEHTLTIIVRAAFAISRDVASFLSGQRKRQMSDRQLLFTRCFSLDEVAVCQTQVEFGAAIVALGLALVTLASVTAAIQ
jgi:hypothetical protein